MPQERSIDIDNIVDFKVVKLLITELGLTDTMLND